MNLNYYPVIGLFKVYQMVFQNYWAPLIHLICSKYMGKIISNFHVEYFSIKVFFNRT